MSDTKLLLTPEEAAARIGLSRRQMYRLLAQRKIRSVKIGRARRIAPSALEEFVERAQDEAAEVVW